MKPILFKQRKYLCISYTAWSYLIILCDEIQQYNFETWISNECKRVNSEKHHRAGLFTLCKFDAENCDTDNRLKNSRSPSSFSH